MKIEILVGLIAIGVIGAVFIPLAFDPAGIGGIDFIDCTENEILKVINSTWTCAVDDTTITEVEVGTFANENTEFRPHLARGTNVLDPIKNFGEYSIRVMEFLPNQLGEVSWDYLVPQDYTLGEDLEFVVYWFKEDGLADGTIVENYNEESTACQVTTTTSTPIIITDSVEFDFQQGKDYLLVANTAWNSNLEDSDLSIVNVKHGTTVFEGSQIEYSADKAAVLPCNTNEVFYKYFWWTVWTPNATESLESISINIDNTNNPTGSILSDDTTFSIITLSDDFTNGVDYFFNQNKTDSVLQNNWTTGNSATLTILPQQNNTDWLVLGTEVSESTSDQLSIQSRLQSTGFVNDVLPSVSKMGNKKNNSVFARELEMQSMSRVFTLSNTTSTTFTLQTQIADFFKNGTASSNPSNNKRLSNSLFAINLDKFSNNAWVWTPQTLTLNDPEFGDQVDTISIGSNSDDKKLFVLADIGIDDPLVNLRTQFDNVDILPQETFQSYHWTPKSNAEDISRWTLSTITPPITNSTHAIDVDSSTDKPLKFRTVTQRSLTSFLLATPPTQTNAQTVCMEARLMSVDVGEDLSNTVVPTFGSWKEVCATTTGGADILRTFEFNFNSTENPFEPEEVGMIQLKRHSANSTNDDYTGKVFALFGELQWIVIP